MNQLATTVFKFLFFLLVAGVLHFASSSQNPFKPPPFPGRPDSPRRIILFERLERPVLIKLTEEYMMHGWIGRDSATTAVHDIVSRIRKDSIYLDSIGYRLGDFESFNLPGFIQYRRSDSLKWKVFYPPEVVYHDRRVYSSYMRDLAKQVKRDKVSSRSARLFDNMLKLNLIKLANLEIALDYERHIYGNWSVETETGYQFAAGDPMVDDFFMGTIPLYKYHGVNFVVGPKYYLGKIPYLQIALIYRYLDMDLARTKLIMTSGKYGLQYQYRNDIGGAIRFGIVTRLGNSGVIDAYIGGGLKVSYINQFIYGNYLYNDSSNNFHWNNTDHSADNNHLSLLLPVINAGIKIGVGF